MMNTFQIATSKAVTALLIGLRFTVGCQTGHLSRSNAKSQLEGILKQHPNRNLVLTQVGRISGNCLDKPTVDPKRIYDNEWAVFSATGCITIRPIRKNVYDVELTQLGTGTIDGLKYAHRETADCDEWQVSFVLSKFDSLDVTGIVEDGVHAKVDTSMSFVNNSSWAGASETMFSA